jgi:hypothetical protein
MVRETGGGQTPRLARSFGDFDPFYSVQVKLRNNGAAGDLPLKGGGRPATAYITLSRLTARQSISYSSPRTGGLA